MTFSEKCVNKPVTTLLVFIMMVALGIFCVFDMPVDMYPSMDLPYMLVYTKYENAGPEEVEQSITRTMESSLSGLSGLKTLSSTSQSGASIIFMEFDYGTNLDTAAIEIRDKIDLVRGYFPDAADAPVTLKLDPSMMPIMNLTLRGDMTPEELRSLAEDTVSKRIEQLDGVASCNVIGGREESINVDIPRDRLEAYGLSISTISKMIGSQNIQSSGGTITAGDTNYTIKTSGKYTSIEDLKNTVISYKPDMLDSSRLVTVKLRDIADVYDGFKDETTLAFLDGNPCVMMQIQKQSGKNSVTAAKNVRKAVAEMKDILPRGVELIETSNSTDIIEQTINEVVKSVIVGALLAIAVLLVFLRSLKSTFIIGLAIPISVFITLMLMYFRGMTINMISMAGLLLGIGMLVDNSIVVLENIYAYRQRDAKPKVAAILGSQEMIASITSSTLTSVCIFLPMIMFKKKLGVMGQMFDSLAYTIIFSLLCSLVVAVALVPVLCSSYLKIDRIVDSEREGFGYGLNQALNKFFLKLDEKYARGVSYVLQHRKKFIAVLVGLLFLSFVGVKFVGFIFMPESSSDTVGIEVELPNGTTLNVTEDTLRMLEEIGKNELKGVKFTAIKVGGTSVISSGSETNTGSITWTLYRTAEREKGWDNEKSAKEKLRKYFNSIPGAKLKFSQNQNNASNGKMSIDIRCDDLNLLRSTAIQVEKILQDYGQELVTEVTSDQEEGLPQAEIVVDRNRMYELGLNIYNVGAEINASINGTVASRYTKKGDDIDVIVRLSEKDKSKLTDLDLISVTSSMGERVPLSSFAHYEENLSPVAVLREDQARMVHVEAVPMPGLSLDVVQSGVIKIINDHLVKDDSVMIGFSGDYEDMMEAVVNFGLIIIIAAILVFIVMASQFESLVDPFIVILTIPLSFIGVVFIYAIVGQRLSVVTIMGMLVLVGTIVNNGIVLVDYTNLLRKRGYELKEACVEAARNRLRPILMSTLTTVISLAPMAFFPGEGSASMQPISLTVFGGMTFGSLMTLFLMPTIYYIVNSRRIQKAKIKAARKEAQIQKKLATLESKEKGGE
ncbi:MAG: efflux RND transporter permease subunit [Treponema sp.]|nr:efflux RND transporter permease subunit [Treponema sp.]MDY5838831.1 efflux RND transporter permease subunit [Treponema sp.]